MGNQTKEGHCFAEREPYEKPVDLQWCLLQETGDTFLELHGFLLKYPKPVRYFLPYLPGELPVNLRLARQPLFSRPLVLSIK